MCTSPLKGWKNDNGSIFLVTRSDVLAVRCMPCSGDIVKVYSSDDVRRGDYTEFIDIPCRSCEECFSQTRREWITRAVCESKLHDSMIFCTFTYNDENIPRSEIVTEDGECLSHYTLDYTHFQKFMKRLRKYFGDKKIRYMVCGEYGSHTYRPHYHAILFGLDFSDFPDIPEFYKRNSQGDNLYIIPTLSELWSHGYVTVSSANTSTMAYVAGYVAKKLTDRQSKKFYDYCGIARPFIRSSKALGAVYFSEIMDKFENVYDYVPIALEDQAFKIYLTSNWKMKYEDKKVYPNLPKVKIPVCTSDGEVYFDDYVDRTRQSDIMMFDKSDYYSKKVARRIKLIDNKFSLLSTDMSKESYNNSRKIDFRNSCKRKRGEY